MDPIRPTFIIAEAGVNHNGSVDVARQLIDAAAAARADAVKFQTFKSEAVISRHAAKADYQKTTTGASESQLDMVRKLELSTETHRQLADHCQERGIRFMSTPFDLASVDFLISEIGIDVVKVASGEITNAPLLLHIARFGRPVVLSTGMSTLGEIERGLGVLAFGYLNSEGRPLEAAFLDAADSAQGRKVLLQNVSLLHCVTEYPAPFAQVNLRVLDTLYAAFGLPVGFSDHTTGISVALAAVARGACIIEKHLTLDRTLPGPDHKASIEPGEFSAMVTEIRHVEQALGSSVKQVAPVEWANRAVARRSLVAQADVHAGEIWTLQNLACKRPGDGISPMRYWEVLGTKARRDYLADELVD